MNKNVYEEPILSQHSPQKCFLLAEMSTKWRACSHCGIYNEQFRFIDQYYCVRPDMGAGYSSRLASVYEKSIFIIRTPTLSPSLAENKDRALEASTVYGRSLVEFIFRLKTAIPGSNRPYLYKYIVNSSNKCMSTSLELWNARLVAQITKQMWTREARIIGFPSMTSQQTRWRVVLSVYPSHKTPICG